LDRHRIWLFRLSVIASLSTATGCGPAIYAANSGAASRALERASHANAASLAPYDYYYAEAFLHKAREEAGEAAYQDAIAYARIARDSAESASEHAGAAMRETSR